MGDYNASSSSSNRPQPAKPKGRGRTDHWASAVHTHDQKKMNKGRQRDARRGRIAPGVGSAGTKDTERGRKAREGSGMSKGEWEHYLRTNPSAGLAGPSWDSDGTLGGSQSW